MPAFSAIGREEPTMLEAPIEQPTLVAEDDQRRWHLTELAIQASRNPPPKIPEPFAGPGPTPEGADWWADHHDQLISWDEVFGELVAACGDMSEAGAPTPSARLPALCSGEAEQPQIIRRLLAKQTQKFTSKGW
jgi:hypothetical protein